MNRLAKLFLPLVLVASAFAFQKESPTLERARQRWEHLSQEDRARFRQRYERYQALSEDERRVLAERAERMRLAKERARAEMTPEVRAKLERLDPRKREAVLREIVENAVRERGARIREKMPEAWVKRLEQARPEERVRFLSELQQRDREKSTCEAIEKIGPKLGLPAAEIDRLKNLPGPERTAAVLDLGKKLAVKYVAESGLPPGLSEQEWQQWLALSPDDFFERVQHHRREHGWEGAGPRAGGESRRGDASKGPPPLPHELMEALRSTPDEVLQYGDLPAQERRQRLFEHRRDRVICVLRESKKVEEAKLAEWSTLGEPEFFKALRAAFPHTHTRRGGPFGGGGGPDHDHDGPGGPPPDDHRGPPSDAEHGRPPSGKRGPPPGERGGDGPGPKPHEPPSGSPPKGR